MDDTNTRAPKISVIVPVYREWDKVPGLIQCIAAQTISKEKLEVILVDNDCSGGARHLNRPPYVSVISCDRKGSYAARNEGVRVSAGGILVFTDADCRPRNSWLEAGVRELNVHGVGRCVIGGAVEVKESRPDSKTIVELYDSVMGIPQERYIKKSGYAVTANLFVGRAVVDSVGLFDATRYSGGDADFCRRAKAMGYGLVYAENASVIHPARREWGELVRKKRRVVGGQIKCGSKARRVTFIMRIIMPPMRAWWYALTQRDLRFVDRMIVIWVQGVLWAVEMFELARLLAGGGAERR